MDAKQKQRLINALKKAGMSVGLADSYDGLDDAALETVIKGLEAANPTGPSMDEVISSEAFTDFINQGGFDKLLSGNKAAQSVFDSKMAKGFNTRLQNWLQQNGDGDAGKGDQSGKGGQGGTKLPDDTPAWAKALVESNDKLQKELDDMKKARKGEKTLDQAKVLLGKSKLPENIQERWLSRISVDSQTSLEDQVKALETEWGEINPGGSEQNPGAQGGQGNYKFQQGQGEQGKLSATEKEGLENFAKSFNV